MGVRIKCGLKGENNTTVLPWDRRMMMMLLTEE